MSKPPSIIKVRPKAKMVPVSEPSAPPLVKVVPKAKSVPLAHESDDEDLMAFPLYDLRKHAGLSDGQSVNESIIEMLDSLIELAQRQKASASGAEKAQHSRRIASFIKAHDAIRDFGGAIQSGAQAQRDIPGVGKGIAQRITEFMRTGTLRELETAVDPETKIILELCTVTGIGEERAKALRRDFNVTGVQDLIDKYKAGIIKVHVNQLTHHMVVGLQYHHDLQLRMPWLEADMLAQTIKTLVQAMDMGLVVHVCGSYRRMKDTCGDLDVLISHPESGDAEESLLPDIVTMLEQAHILVGHLTSKGKTKYMGICKVPDDPSALGRRIDIRYVAYGSLGAATLYFTGSGKFNKIMRFYANQRGFTLNEYGLYKYINGVKGDLVPAPTERDIFKILNFVYLEPTERDF